MTVHRYFKRVFPPPENTGLTERAMEANNAINAVLQESPSTETTKIARKRSYLVFSDEHRVKIGQYTADNGNAAAVKKFNGEFGGCNPEVSTCMCMQVCV